MPFAKLAASLALLSATTLPALAGGPLATATEAPVAAVAEAPADPWNGAWGALIAGSGRSTLDIGADVTSPQAPGQGLGIDLPDFGGSGSLAGVEVGYGHRFGDRFAWGVQLGHSASAIDTGAGLDLALGGLAFDFDYRYRARSMTSLLGRLGYLVNDDSMIFALAGVTRARFEGSYTISAEGGGFAGGYDLALTGLTLGAGIETLVTDKVALRLDYRITNFGDYNLVDTSVLGADFSADLESNLHTVNAAVILRF